jgi:plastocyanin
VGDEMPCVRLARVIVVAAAAAAVTAACGKDSGTAPSANVTCSSIPNPATTFLILNNAVCPASLTVPRGTRVTFINNDPRAHEMTSDPHPEHTDCPELNAVGHLESGQQRESGNLNVARRCGFHDHINENNRALQGSITIQ